MADRDCVHGQLARVCDYCELEAEIAALRAQLEQAQDKFTKTMLAAKGQAVELGEQDAIISRQREWIEKAGHRPGCAITKCKTYPGCSSGQYSPVHSARHFAFEHVFIPSRCDCGYSELTEN